MSKQSYLNSVKKYGYIPRNKTLHTATGNLFGLDSSVLVDQVRKQLGELKNDRSRSPFEKSQFAAKQQKLFMSKAEKLVDSESDRIRRDMKSLAQEKEKVLKSNLTEAERMIVGLEVLKMNNDSITKSLGDRDVLASLERLPSTLRPSVSDKTIAASKDSFIRNHASDLHDQQSRLEHDSKQLQTLAEIFDSFDKDYKGYQDNSALSTAASELD